MAPSIPISTPPALVAEGAQLAYGVDLAVRALDTNQDTYTAGLRWDVRPDIDLKFQVDTIRAKPGETGLMVNLDPNQPSTWNGKATVMAITLDFILGGGR